MKLPGLVLLILLSILSQVEASHFRQHDGDSLVVSFISIGAGVDYKAKTKLEAFILDFENHHQVQLNASIKHWGREGETDYIYDLTKLSRKQCKAFVEEIETLFSKNKLVKISHSLVD